MNSQTDAAPPLAAPTGSASRYTRDGLRRLRESMIRNWREGKIKPKPQEEYERMWQKSNQVTRGTNGFGRQARGRADHGRALVWTVESPDGETWTVANLTEWCRQNEDIFPAWPGAKMPTWKRAADGLALAFRRGYSWHGWSIVSCEPNSMICGTQQPPPPAEEKGVGK
jgi:hypothetical protein